MSQHRIIILLTIGFVGVSQAFAQTTTPDSYGNSLPVAYVDYGQAASTQKKVESVSPEAVYNASCVACHGTGVLNAPKLADKVAWKPLISVGLEGLLASAIKGKNAMPPRGGNATLSDESLKATIAWMMSKSE